MYKLVGFFKDIFLGIQLLSGLFFLSRPMTSDFEGFPTKILSITFLSYLNSWEKAEVLSSLIYIKLLLLV